VAAGRTPSLAVFAARRGTVLLHEAFGQQRPGPDAPPLRRDAALPISSVTKPITATLLMLLVEDGDVAVGRPVREYLPELGPEAADPFDEVLVHHLLNHTSGYDDDTSIAAGLRALAAGEIGPLPPGAHAFHDVVLANLHQAPRATPPGAAMVYANVNYTLIGEIVKRVSGQPLEVFARERLFGPLGMTDTDFVLREDLNEKRIERPLDAPFSEFIVPGVPGMENADWRNMIDGGLGVFTTVRDLGVFGQMILNRGRYGDARILSRVTVDEMTRDHCPGLGVQVRGMKKRHASYGYGWCIASDEVWRYFGSGLPPRGTLWHTGLGGAQLAIDPVHEIVMVYFEVALEVSPDLEPVSWSCDRFTDVLTSAVDD